MGLCAGCAVADFKPICRGKIGLVYHPSFIEHILFVNPTNYISFCYRLFSLLFFFSLFAHTNAHKQPETKVTVSRQGESNTAVNIGTDTVGYKMQTTVSTQTKRPLFTQTAMAVEQLEKDHMVWKTVDNHAVTPHHKLVCCITFSLAPHKHTVCIYDQLPSVHKQRSMRKQAANHQ